MGRQRDKGEEIVGTLRQAEVLHGQGLSMAEAIRPRGISEVTCARWRKAWGGMSGDQLRRLKELEKDPLVGVDPRRTRIRNHIAMLR